MILNFSPYQPLEYELEDYEIEHLCCICHAITMGITRHRVPESAVRDIMLHPLSVRLIPILYKAHLKEWKDLIHVKSLPYKLKDIQKCIDYGYDFYIHYGDAIKFVIQEYQNSPEKNVIVYPAYHILRTDYLWEEINKYDLIPDKFGPNLYFKNPVDKAIYPKALYIN